jgi:hypothetical protein
MFAGKARKEYTLAGELETTCKRLLDREGF